MCEYAFFFHTHFSRILNLIQNRGKLDLKSGKLDSKSGKTDSKLRYRIRNRRNRIRNRGNRMTFLCARISDARAAFTCQKFEVKILTHLNFQT